METKSIWLGAMRRPVRMAMLFFLATTFALGAWLIVGAAFFGTGIGMHEILRPAGRLPVILGLWSFLAATIFVSLYLSDTIGAIEVEPTGVIDWLSLVISRMAMVGIVGIVVVMFYEVVARYLFEKPTLWANELSLWIAGFVFLFAGLYAMQQRSHIRIYVIYDMMPRWARKTADVMTVFLIWVFAYSLIYGGYNEVKAKILRMEAFGTAWDPPIPSTIKLAILVLISLVAIQALSNLIFDWKKENSFTSADEIDETEIENIRRTLED